MTGWLPILLLGILIGAATVEVLRSPVDRFVCECCQGDGRFVDEVLADLDALPVTEEAGL